MEEFLAVMHAKGRSRPNSSGVRFSLFSGDVGRADGAGDRPLPTILNTWTNNP